MARLDEFYRTVVVPNLMKKFGYKSIMQVPKITKITLNTGAGDAVGDKKIINFVVDNLTKISGQKPIVTLAKKSIAGFKIREGWPIGCKVTLRKSRMYEFMDRLISIALPRVRDFRGLNPKSFDGTGNYSMGLTEHIVFPEIDLDFEKNGGIRGLDICFTTSAKTDEEARALLLEFNLPLRDREKH